MSDSLTIVTRTSPLALWQAHFIQHRLQHHYPHLTIHIKGVKTQGDRWLDMPLYKMGGKSVFVKELEHVLLEKQADLAVHSLKDMPVELPEGLILAAICERENPFDAWVCPSGHTLMTLAPGSVVGTSSLRRQVQLGALRPDLIFKPLRGNVGSRLEKCLAGEWDAIVLAVAGLLRLGEEKHITAIFDETQMVPAVGQGALGIECRKDDEKTYALLQALHHAPTQACVLSERAMNRALGGSCHVPIGGYAKCEGSRLFLVGRVGDISTYDILEAKGELSVDDPEVLGRQVANSLIAKGAMEYIQKGTREK